MKKRQNILGVGVSAGLVVGMLTMASGCVAPQENQEPAESESESDGEVGTASQAVNTWQACNYAANGNGTAGKMEAQKRALQALKYILGGNDISGCNGFKAEANVVRAAIKAKQLNITNSSSAIICDTVPAKRIRMTEAALQTTRTSGPLWNALHKMAVTGGVVDQCFGTGASTFFVLQTNANYPVSGKYQNWVEFDPSPATLTANLSTSGTGTSAYAAAKYDDNSATRVYKWSSNGGSCSGSYAGLTCATGTANSGTVHVKSIVNDDGWCFCK